MASEKQNEIFVYKFGGSSLKDAPSIRQVANIIQNQKKNLVVVVSAMGGITDLMLNAANEAAKGKQEEVLKTKEIFIKRHIDAISEVLPESQAAEAMISLVEAAAGEFEAICESVSILRELTDRTLAKILARGERMMAQLLAAHLKLQDGRAAFLDATEVIKVAPGPMGYFPEASLCDKACESILRPLVEKAGVVVVPGFIGEGTEKELALLGRGGSDFSASILGASLPATSVTLYKEVDGILTADPRYVEEAQIVKNLHYREAAELAYYGAKILHPFTIIPLTDRHIPLHIKNTFHPDRTGTLITSQVKTSEIPVKALTAIPDQAVIAIEGKGMTGVPGIAGRTFLCLARSDISVTMISQASSESSICFVVPGREAKVVKELLEREFQFEMARHLIDDVKVKARKAIVALVGLGMSGRKGTAARAFSSFAREGLNIEVIAQGSSELNISVVVEDHHVGRALSALHREFRLEKAHALPDLLGAKVSVAILGFGQIGTTLASQIAHQKDFFRDHTKSDCQIVSLTDTSGSRTFPEGLSQEALKALVAEKKSGVKLTNSKERQSLINLTDGLRKDLWTLPFAKGIFVDCTAEETAPVVLESLKAGMHVVLANKKPLAVPYDEYQAVFDEARRKNLSVRYEATVGAGLPILDTIAKLDAAGDRITTIYGCLSGTLGYLMTEVEDGLSFSQAVKKAYDLGYTEPDPREDLSGMDVARKALILARTLGMRIDMKQIELMPLYPSHLDHENPEDFVAGLKALDSEFQEKIERAQRENKVLRYVARLSENDVSVKIEAIAKDSALGRLRGTDNQVTLITKRYEENPLVVTGPGAGADVTAAGVLNDIVAIAALSQN